MLGHMIPNFRGVVVVGARRRALFGHGELMRARMNAVFGRERPTAAIRAGVAMRKKTMRRKAVAQIACV